MRFFLSFTAFQQLGAVTIRTRRQHRDLNISSNKTQKTFIARFHQPHLAYFICFELVLLCLYLGLVPLHEGKIPLMLVADLMK